MKIICDIKLLEKQLYAILKSDLPKSSKSGLHSFLGEIFDILESGELVTIKGVNK